MKVGAHPINRLAAANNEQPNILGDANGLCQEAIEALPAAVYMTDAEGRITFYNEAAAALWGCRPELGDSKFFGSWKLYRPDGTPLPHDQCPMAMALHQKRPIRGMEAVAERPDGTRVPFIPYPTPLFDSTGRLTGAVNMLVDISERKRAEQVHAEREAQLAVFVEHAPAAIAMFDREMRYLAASRRFVVDYHLPAGAQLIGRSHYEVFPNVPQRWRDIHARVLAGEELSEDEDQYTRYDGLTDWVRWSMVPWHGANGNIGGALLFAEIITEQVERRRALADSEARFGERKAQLDLAGKIARIGTFAYDHRRKKSQLSPGFATIYGLPEGTLEISPEDWRARVHPDDLPQLDAIVRQAFTNGEREYVMEFRIFRGGQVRWIESRVLVSYNEAGKPVRRIGAQIDVTERKQAEQALAERNAQLDLAHRTARVGCYSYDISSKTMRLSRASAASQGLSGSTIVLTSEQFFARVHRDEVQRVREEYDLAVAERHREFVCEFRFVRPGGEVRWIETRNIVTCDEAGRAERMTGVYIDVTERRKNEDQKSRLIAELDHRVKNVLACVAVVAQRSRESSKSADEFLEVLDGRINSLANTHTLLSRSRWEGVSLGELVRSELAFCSNDHSARIEGREVTLVAEATQPMAMVLHELATNAVKYGALSTGAGRVLVRWRRQPNGGSGGKLVLEWREAGGPPVNPPTATGYGTSVIRDLIPYELGGAVDYMLAPEGARCRLKIPAKWLSSGPGLHAANGANPRLQSAS